MICNSYFWIVYIPVGIGAPHISSIEICALVVVINEGIRWLHVKVMWNWSLYWSISEGKIRSLIDGISFVLQTRWYIRWISGLHHMYIATGIRGSVRALKYIPIITQWFLSKIHLIDDPPCSFITMPFNECDGISNHWCLGSLFNCLFRCISKKTSKLHITGFCEVF